MSITPLKFTGISDFSDDFQAIVDRTVAIASLPVKTLESYQQEILADKVALGSLSAATAQLASSLERLSALESASALSVSSTSSKVAASIGSGAAPGAYIVSDIASLAQSAVYTAVSGLAGADTSPVDSDGVLSLVIDGVEHQITLGLEENTLAGLRDAINGAGLGVAASIIDTGGAPERYFLTLVAEEPGARTFELRTETGNPASNLIAQTRAGSDAQFMVNGKPVTAKDNNISGVIPGVNLLLNQTTSAGEEIVVTVGLNRAAVAEALSSFVEAYNAMVATLDMHRGEAGGSLTGEMVVQDLQSRLTSLTTVTGTGSVGSLAGLGITLGRDGLMSFDSSVINGMSSESFADALHFLSSATEGLGARASSFDEFSDPLTGFISAELEQLDEANDRFQEQIDAANERINAMQATLLAKLQAADALLASLEGQKGMLDATLESLNIVTNGRREG
jgi:flagellar hook-associated protein 2